METKLQGRYHQTLQGPEEKQYPIQGPPNKAVTTATVDQPSSTYLGTKLLAGSLLKAGHLHMHGE